MFAPGNDPRAWLSGWYPQWAEAYAHASSHPPRDSWYGKVRSPLLDLQADQDAWRPPATRNELRELLGDKVSVRRIIGAGHALVPERPDEIAAEITAWVRRLP
jgi:pimeloyl-ACP methyl ester carboxylesterase